MSWIPTTILAALITSEAVSYAGRYSQRKALYDVARQRAQELGRTLVVIGDPDGGVTHGGYGCGDVCIDIDDCKRCENHIKADITKGPIEAIPSGSAVVFVSCVLEYVEKYDEAWQEIIRMAGSDSNVFVVYAQPWTLTASLYPGAKQTISTSGDVTHVSAGRKILISSGIVGLVAWALWPKK